MRAGTQTPRCVGKATAWLDKHCRELSAAVDEVMAAKRKQQRTQDEAPTEQARMLCIVLPEGVSSVA